LRYRLKHISDITGIDLKDAETCFKLGASFKVRRYLNHNKLTFTR
jgi:DNA-binding PucR family transcriptional regulator